MIGTLEQLEAGRKTEEWLEKARVEAHDLRLDVSEAQEAERLRDENTRLRKLVADLSFDKEALQSVIRKNGWGS
jgi:putative transposase